MLSYLLFHHLFGIILYAGHAMGFWHEQSRPDRDEHVEIIWENIKEGQSKNLIQC